MAVTTPIRPGTKSTSVVHEADLTKRVRVAGTEYIVVKASAAIGSLTAGAALGWDDASAGTVNAVAGAAASKGVVAGIVPADAEFTALADGDYLLLVRRGIVDAAVAGAVQEGDALAVHGSSGLLDDTTVTDATTVAWANAAAGGAGTVSVMVDLP